MTSDQIGRLAELIAAKDLAKPVRRHYRRPLFRATFPGEKYPTVDFIVDALDRNDQSLAFFFIQVKGTATADITHERLAIGVPADRYNRLARLPAPTYVVGVDVIAESSFIVAANRPRTTDLTSIAKTYCLGEDRVRIDLYKEVLEFWIRNRPALGRTRFKDAQSTG
jgi:hypothetical protein